MALTEHGKERLLNAFFSQGQAPPTNFRVCLYTVLPDVDSGEFGTAGTEVSTSGTGYNPQVVANNTTNFPVATNFEIDNNTVIDFGTATTGWGTLVGAGLKDHATGNLLDATAFTTPQVVVAGNLVSFPIGALKFRLFNQA